MLAYDNFRQIFEHSKRAYWWLYQGRTKVEGKLIGSNTEVENYVDSWAALDFLLQQYGDGVYCIELRSTPTSARGGTFHVFQVGEGETAQVSGLSPALARVQPPDHTAAFTKGIDMRYWLEKCDALANQVRKLELELLEMRHENNRLRDAADERPDFTDKILGIVEKRPEIITHITGMFAGGQAPAAIGQLGAKKPIPPAPKRQRPPVEDDPDEWDQDEDDEEEDDNPATVGRTFSLDRAAGACYRLMRALPEQDINDLLEKLAAVAEKDPNKIKMAIAYL